MKKIALILTFAICTLFTTIAQAAWQEFHGSVTIGDCVFRYSGLYNTETGHGTLLYDGGDCGHGQIWWLTAQPSNPIEPLTSWNDFVSLHEIEEIEGDENVLLACFNDAANDPNW